MFSLSYREHLHLLIFTRPLASLCLCSPPARSGAALPGTAQPRQHRWPGKRRGTVTHRAGGMEGTPPLAPSSPAAMIASCGSHARSPPGRASASPPALPPFLPSSFSPFARRPHPMARTRPDPDSAGDGREKGREGGKETQGTDPLRAGRMAGMEREKRGMEGNCSLRAGQQRGMEGDSSPLDRPGWRDGWMEGYSGTAPLRAGRNEGIEG